MKKCQPSPLSPEFAKALKSFLGYLEGTEKSAHTIKNYRLDILSFYDFLDLGLKKNRLETLSVAELDHYHEHLKAVAHKTNTRRRKLLTAHRFLRYLSKRNQLESEIPLKLPAPHKVERVPFTVPRARLLAAIRSLPIETKLDRRNRALLCLLAETACLVSEVGLFRFEHFGEHELSVPGKAARKIPLSTELKEEIEALRAHQKPPPPSGHPVFFGFNKHGPLSSPISPRGVELLVRFHGVKLGFPGLTPRTFRHSVVLAWFQEGVKQDEIQRRLGLKTAYAFRTFAPLLESLKSSEKTTSTA